MPWKTEIDRLVSRALLDAAKGGDNERKRGLKTVQDLIDLAPDRVESHFLLGTAEEIFGDAAADLPASEEPGDRWRHLGRLDAAARRGERERVRELMEDPMFEASIEQPEGRVALRSVGRQLLREGEDERVFEYYRRHLGAVPEEGSRRDAEFLLEEALRRADRYERGERDENEALARLGRAAAFAGEAGLEPRAAAKVDRKMGRVHQLGERWDDAADCYRRALERLPAEDPYRSVLIGDLALATLGVRGTLDLLPDEEREGREEAMAILQGEGEEGEGRSYNAIYTLGLLHYEAGGYEDAATCFAEADALMRENRAKARIVHARSRFFLGHALLMTGAEEEALESAQRYIERDASASNLDAAVKDPVFEALREAVPDARVPGRRRSRSRRRERDTAPPSTSFLEQASRILSDEGETEEHLHRALELVDKAFKSRPDFDTWFGAYRLRLAALMALNEREEALRTYERFRAKLYQRNTLERIESLLLDANGPLSTLLDDATYNRELVDLYEVMPDRDEQFVEACVACAQACMEAGDEAGLLCAQRMLREAEARDPDAVKALLGQVESAVAEAGVGAESASADECREAVAGCGEQVHILLVGGDEGRRPHLERFHQLASDIGFEGSWIFTGARPPHKTLQEIEETAENTHAILLHHRTAPDLRAEVKRLAEDMDIPLRESTWMGAGGVHAEVLLTLRDAFE